MSLDAAMTRGQAAVLLLLRDSATVTHTPLESDGAGGWRLGTVTTTTVAANVQRQMSAQEAQVAAQQGVVSPAIIRLPAGTVVAAGDRIAIGDTAFTVVTPLSGTLNLTARVLCAEYSIPIEVGSLLRTAAVESVYGSTWHERAVTPPAPGGSVTIASPVTRNGAVVHTTISHLQQALPAVGLWASEWLWVGAVSEAIGEGSYLDDGAGHVFVVTAAPEIDRGVRIAPLRPTKLPGT